MYVEIMYGDYNTPLTTKYSLHAVIYDVPTLCPQSPFVRLMASQLASRTRPCQVPRIYHLIAAA